MAAQLLELSLGCLSGAFFHKTFLRCHRGHAVVLTNKNDCFNIFSLVLALEQSFLSRFA